MQLSVGGRRRKGPLPMMLEQPGSQNAVPMYGAGRIGRPMHRSDRAAFQCDFAHVPVLPACCMLSFRSIYPCGLCE